MLFSEEGVRRVKKFGELTGWKIGYGRVEDGAGRKIGRG